MRETVVYFTSSYYLAPFTHITHTSLQGNLSYNIILVQCSAFLAGGSDQTDDSRSPGNVLLQLSLLLATQRVSDYAALTDM